MDSFDKSDDILNDVTFNVWRGSHRGISKSGKIRDFRTATATIWRCFHTEPWCQPSQKYNNYCVLSLKLVRIRGKVCLSCGSLVEVPKYLAFCPCVRRGGWTLPVRTLDPYGLSFLQIYLFADPEPVSNFIYFATTTIFWLDGFILCVRYEMHKIGFLTGMTGKFSTRPWYPPLPHAPPP